MFAHIAGVGSYLPGPPVSNADVTASGGGTWASRGADIGCEAGALGTVGG